MTSSLSVYFPVPVAVFLRGLITIFSSFSPSQPSIILRRNDDLRTHDGSNPDKWTRSGAQKGRKSAAWSVLGQWKTAVGHRADGFTRVFYRKPIPELRDGVVLNSTGVNPSSSGRSWLPIFLSNAQPPDPHYANPPPLPSPPRQQPQDPPASSQQPRSNSPDPPLSPLSESQDIIHRLMRCPVLFDPARAPRHPIVLCHGLYGFDVRGPPFLPFLRTHYWSNVLHILRRTLGADVIVTAVPSTGSVAARAHALHRQLEARAAGRGVNFLAHSMGGLDCRWLISGMTVRAHEGGEDILEDAEEWEWAGRKYVPLSLTTVCTPHQGSPFMDWCEEHIGIGKIPHPLQPDSQSSTWSSSSSTSSTSKAFTSTSKSSATATSTSTSPSLPLAIPPFILSYLDSPAYADLTTSALRTRFNPTCPDHPRVRYFSVAARAGRINVWHPLWLPKLVMDAVERADAEQRTKDGRVADEDLVHRHDLSGNDGLVSVRSAMWGTFLGTIEGADHWEMRGARGLELELDWSRFLRAFQAEQNAQVERKLSAREMSGSNPSDMKKKKAEDAKARQTDALLRASLRASTDRLSAAFDWLAEQVPVSLVPALRRQVQDDVEQSKEAKERTEKNGRREKERRELATKKDLERFYVALARKLYDEGL